MSDIDLHIVDTSFTSGINELNINNIRSFIERVGGLEVTFSPLKISPPPSY